MTFNRNCLLLVICIASMFKGTVGECAKTLRNTVVQEGAPLTLDAGDNQNCTWFVVPSDVVFNTLKHVTDGEGDIVHSLNSTYALEGSRLVIYKAETQPVDNPYATSGIYIAECPGSDCVTAAKVVVINSGPTCSCAYDPVSHTTIFSATIVYGDTPKNDMYPLFSYALRGETVKIDMQLPAREDKYRFSATSQHRIRGKSIGVLPDFKVVVTFAEPSNFPIPGIDPKAPAFTASCQFDKACN